MFDGKSKTRYVGTGKQKDMSKAKLLSDARAKREKRALDKKRHGGAVAIQTCWWRYSATKHSSEAVMKKLSGHLATIEKISAVMEFNVPLDTLHTLMRCSVFLTHRAAPDSSDVLDSFNAVLNQVLRSSCHSDHTFCLFNLDNVREGVEQQRRWQVLVSCFLCSAVDISNTQMSTEGSEVVGNIGRLIHALVSFIETCTPADLPVVLGVARAVSVPLCGFLRALCFSDDPSEGLSLLTSNISKILRFSLMEHAHVAGGLGVATASYERLWYEFTTQLLRVPRVWGHVRLCPLLEYVLGLTAAEHCSEVLKEGAVLKEEQGTMAVWRNILSSAANNVVVVPPFSCDSRRPFATLSHLMYTEPQMAGDVKKDVTDDDHSKQSPSFLLVNNFFDYAIHRDPSLLSYSPHSTRHWVDMLSRALNKQDVPLIAAINEYHGTHEVADSGNKRQDDDEYDDEDDDEENEEKTKGVGSRANIGTRDVVNTILEDAVGQTRSRLVRRHAEVAGSQSAQAKSTTTLRGQDSKRPRLLAVSVSSSIPESSGDIYQPPSVADTVELLNYLSHPRVLSAVAEHSAACLARGEGSECNSHMEELLHLLSVLLIYSPAGTNFSAGPAKRASIASKILGVFSFGRTSRALVEGLWHGVKTFTYTNPGEYTRQFVLENPYTSSKVASSSGLFGPVTSTAASVTTSVTNLQNSSLIVLLCILSHQLLAIDDEEFMEGSKALRIVDLCDLVIELKTLMYQMYWVSPVLTRHESEFDDEQHSSSASELKSSDQERELTFLRIHLNNLQLMYIATKVFNQLSVRNERMHFLPPTGWLWTSLGNSELDGLNVDTNPFQDSKATRARMVLLLCPQVVPFNQRAVFFQRLIRNDKAKQRNPQGGHFSSSLRVNIHRAALFDSTFETLSRRSNAEWKKNIQVVFINEQGVEESGIDGGGLFKEFVDVLLKDMFSTPRQEPPPPLHRGNSLTATSSLVSHSGERTGDNSGVDVNESDSDVVALQQTAGGSTLDDNDYRRLFLTTATGMLVPNPTSVLDPSTSRGSLEQYLFMGKMLGKAVYEEILVEPQFAGMFLNHLLGRTNFIDDLVTLDQEIYHSLLKLKRDYLHGDGNIEELELTFEVDVVTPAGDTISRELMPGGSSVAVTRDNLVSYLYLYANFKLNIETHRQSLAFLQGFRELIPVEWMRMFNTSELQLVIGGDNERGIDLPSLRALCTYSGGYHPSQPYIQSFWGIMESLSPADQGEFLRFVTSCSRPPLLGYGQFNPPFNIMKISQDGGGVSGSKRLPMAASCFNQFKLPQYDTVEELREKLLYSIQSKAGFELS